MFAAMKNLLKEKPTEAGAVKLADLHEGCVVGFGFMPQKNISGKRTPLTEVNSYLFDDDSFLSYRLQDDDVDVNLIIADGDNQAHTYLALSQRIEKRFFASLFAAKQPEAWYDMQQDESLDVAARVLGVPQGWVAPHYTLTMSTRGHILEGDFRLRKAADRTKLSRAFNYVLLVDAANNYALEAERYDDGEVVVYATIYRPVTDIGELSRPHRTPFPSFAEPEVETPPAETTNKTAAEPTEVTPLDSILTLPEIAPVHGKFGRIQPVTAPACAPEQPEMLACETRLAGRIIDEAERNQMLLSELIRKVIDLPARIQEEVHIPFALEDTEYAELARRYDIPVTDRAAIRAYILEELKQFVGLK